MFTDYKKVKEEKESIAAVIIAGSRGFSKYRSMSLDDI